MTIIDPDFPIPQIDLANLCHELAHIAYSLLTNTPNGLPSNGYYFNTNRPDIICCDEVATWISDYRPIRDTAEEFLTQVRGASCPGINWAVEISIVLSRPCRPVMDSDGSRSKPEKRDEYAKNLAIDIRTLTTGLVQYINNHPIAGEDYSYRYWLKSVKTADITQAYCSRIEIPILFELSSLCPDPALLVLEE